MIRIEETVPLRRDAAEVFAFLADFRNLPKWDPGIAEARQLEGEEAGVGARYEVVATFLGRRVPMTYRTARHDAEARARELVGEGATLTATDRITVRETAGGAEVRWQADFEMKGALRYAEPLMKPLFRRLGAKAMAGLRRSLG